MQKHIFKHNTHEKEVPIFVAVCRNVACTGTGDSTLATQLRHLAAHGFPATYKALGLGKLIGAPVPGTMTAVWWETQIDHSIVFGVPQVAIKDMNGNYLENQLLMPDIEVYNSPEDNISGRDRQIEAGVAHLLEVIGKK